MSLKLVVKNAINLVNTESMGGVSDPYVTVSFQGNKQKTTVQKGTLTPEWNEELLWDVSEKPPRPDETMEIEVKDYERIGWNKLMGKASLPLRNLLHGGGSGTLELEQPLMDAHHQLTTALLKMAVTYSPPPAGAATALPPAAGGGAGGAAAAAPASSPSTTLAVPSKDGSSPAPFSGGGPDVTGASNARERLSNVTTKFQIRVRVVEARQLMGAGGGDLNPVCRVKLERGSTQENQQTRVIKGCQSPWFNQLFFFNVECLPNELMESFLEFKVCNSSLLRSSTTIGTFKCELGMVYDQTDHALINKWLVLTHPEEATPTVQGYLKASVAVLCPGNNCPEMPATHSDADDVEDNLLWAAGVHLQPASFSLAVFCAQDLPRMDSGTMQSLKEILGIGKASKELVDPYMVASYAGREVQTKVLYLNDNPEFRQTLMVGFLFPSMCNTLRLTLMDWDRVGNDDVIGTAVIPINAISAAGDDGFLPTFGPAYVNFYGSQREWELWQSSSCGDMNLGGSEGVAFRGRALVSLHTDVGSYPSSPLTNMNVLEFEKVRRYRATRNFTLLAHLTHVSLLKEASKPLQVEVSIGNFGNKLENTLMPSPSTTHPANPVFDGCKYYYLAWGEAAPLVSVQCQWEDICHRLHASNTLLNAAQALEKDVTALKTNMKSNRSEEDAAILLNLIMETLQKAKQFCSTPLPAADPVRHSETSLDVHLRQKRALRLSSLAARLEDIITEKNKCTSVERSEAEGRQTYLQYALDELEAIVLSLRDLAVEPQSSIPDVFLWLMSGTERLAYIRVPAGDILHSSDPRSSGVKCGRFSCFPVTYPGTGQIAGVIRGSLWLGRTDEVRQWWSARNDLQLTIYAETYENQVSTVGSDKWSSKGALMTRPAFSDADGLMALEKDALLCPEGWKFQGDWFISPDPSIQYNLDAGHAVYAEEVFEQQARVPGGAWLDAPTHFADVRGDPAPHRDEVECPSGWAWRDYWTIDLQRAVDCEGWEYTVQKGVMGWTPGQKVYHVLRRRRWYRERQREGKIQKSQATVEGWEYSSLFSRRYHAKERRVDVVRRRRWRRKMVPSDPAAVTDVSPNIVVNSGDKEGAPQHTSSTRQYVMSSERHSYQLRAHIYQARDLTPGDKTGLSDPYAVVSFCELSQQTEKQCCTLCPTWDQTLLFDDVRISGPLMDDQQNPPSVVVTIYDWDARGSPEFLGTVMCRPTVQDPQKGYLPTPLKWHQLTMKRENNVDECGEILASFELLLGGLEDAPPTRGNVFMVPFDVRPRLQKTRIEVLCWGVRNMATFELQSVTRPSVEFECGGQSVSSTIMKNIRNNPNFDDPHLSFDVELPREDQYMPPLTLRVLDHRSFGSRPVVASAVVTDLSKFTVSPTLSKEKFLQRPTTTDLQKATVQKPGTVDSEVDWWAKFYASCLDAERCGSYLAKGYEKLEVLSCPLEALPQYSGFTDLISTIPLLRGKGESAATVGEFKGTFRVYPLPSSAPAPEPPKVLASYPSPAPKEVTARVYVVLAKDLAPKDVSGSSDPYVVVKLGKQTRSGVKEYKPNTLNPVFGSVFEVSGTLPVNKDLIVQVWDKDVTSSDDLIGETVIDLENRYLTRHRATLGIAKQYHVSGANTWRDQDLPSSILQEYAQLYHTDLHWNTKPLSVTLGDNTYTLEDFELPGAVVPQTLGSKKQCLALHVLHSVFHLVPEHVETRDLSHPARPGLPQGKLLLWVDLFSSTSSIPPAVDITPRKPHSYELRVVVYNVFDVPLQESNIAGERMSDVYVKGWLQGTKHVLKTDVHYRCMDGEANFNWRLVFPFEYLEAEQCLVLSKKTKFYSADETEERRPPQLTLQLWDNDLILHDDYLSEMTLNLCKLPKPARSKSKVVVPPMLDNSRLSSSNCDGTATSILIGDQSDDHEPLVNLFEVKRVFGFFPFTRVEEGTIKVAGCLEAEIEVLHCDEVKERPAGVGRDPPNQNPVLKEPDRPATSFFWLSSPWKSFKFVLWRNYKWYIITFIVLFLLMLFAFLFIYSLPAATVERLLS